MAKKKAVVRILSKKTGLGNQVQFIPVIEELKKNYIVCSDSGVYNELGLDLEKNQQADINIVVFGYNYLKFWVERLTKRGKFYGFRYRIKGRFWGLGYRKSFAFRSDISEIENNIQLYNQCFGASVKSFKYKIPGWAPEEKLIIAGISAKSGKKLSAELWKKVIKEIEKEGFIVKTVDDNIGGNHLYTPTIKSLKNELSKASYFIGTDSGVAHLADILGIPSLIMFGPTSIIKNKPYQKESKVISRKLKCSPCYNWGRINCGINYECMNFELSHIMKSFRELVKTSS